MPLLLPLLWIGGGLAGLAGLSVAADRSTTLVKWLVVGGVVYLIVKSRK